MSTSVGQGIQSGTDYAWQLFFDAVRQAMASTASPQARLATLTLGVCHLRESNFPDSDAWDRFQTMMGAASGHAAKATPAKILAATEKMSDEEAGRWLQDAVRILCDLSEENEF